MASKQLGKLRQWAGEKITSDKKTIATEEFKEVEVEVERRRIGLDLIYENSQVYYSYLTKKREGNDPDQKLSAIEAMGKVMVSHGEEFGPDSAYGHGLSALGNAHIKVAVQQDEFAEAFKSLYLARLETSIAEIAQFYALRKKLKSRRLAYDAAVSQSQKQFKREKEKTDAEEEVTKARARFEEISTEVGAQVERIQDAEMDQFRDLGRLVDLEYKFVEGWLNQLKEIKADWPNDSEVYRIVPPQSQGPTHILQSAPSSKSAREEGNVSDSSGPSQRPTQHQRTTSIATTNSGRKSSSMSTWASAAVGSFLRREKSSNFEELNDDEKKQGDAPNGKDDPSAQPSLKRTKSGRAVPPPPRSRAQSTMSQAVSSKNNSPRLPVRNLPPEKPAAQKTRRALYAFSGATDELTIEVGDEITVISEPSETWWMGECKGKRGLFPVSYTEDAPKRPPLPARPSNLGKPVPPELPPPRSRSNSNTLTKKNLSPDWTDEPFGDQYSAQSPDYRQTTFDRDESDDDEGERLLADRSTEERRSREEAGSRSASKSSPGTAVRQLRRSLSGKKPAPPPPPPSRRSNSASVARLPSSDSTGGSPFLGPTNPTPQWEPSSSSGHGKEYSDSKSPFEEGEGVSFSSFSLTTKCRMCSCEDFQQNLFKKDGYCNTCFHSHT